MKLQQRDLLTRGLQYRLHDAHGRRGVGRISFECFQMARVKFVILCSQAYRRLLPCSGLTQGLHVDTFFFALS
jgi:hypothetical protein